MTPEQNEQWQRAIMRAYPAPTPDGQECTLERWQDHRRAEAAVLALLPAAERTAFLRRRVKDKDSTELLAGWNVPNWVLEFRDYFATHIYDSGVAEFALRSDVALIGMQLRYPTLESRAEPYERLLLDLLSGMLRPLVEATEANNDTDLRHDYEGYHQICQLCESDGLYREQERWLDIKNLALDRPMRTNKARATFLVDQFARLALRILFQIVEPGPLGARPIGRTMFYFPSEYRACGLYNHRIEQAFLDALEAECPPPDWLPILFS